MPSVPVPINVRCYSNSDYSITSSARASNVGGTVRPSALAVLRLMTGSYLVGAERAAKEIDSRSGPAGEQERVCEKSA